MDALKQIVYALRLKPLLFTRSNLSAPWGFWGSISNAAAFHVVEHGHAWLRLPDRPPILLQQGDLIVVSNTARYGIVDDLATEPIPFRDLIARRNDAGLISLAPQADSASTVLLCGEFRPDLDILSPLFALMPPLIMINNQEGHAVEWLQLPLQSIASESATSYPGYEVVISRLMDILFIMVIRFWIAHHAPNEGGWLRALYDPQLGDVLAAMHLQPEQNWTVTRLAEIGHLSRSTFSAHFTALVGEPPMKYLTRWRIQKAMNALIDQPNWTVEQVAQSVGYESVYAFSKTFKRFVGLSPRDYRRQQRLLIHAET